MKISGALPKGKADGISVAEEKVIRTRRMVAAMVILMPATIDEDVETGDKQARMKIRSIEAIIDDEDGES